MKHYTENLKKLYKNIDCEFDFTLECFVYDTLENDPQSYVRPAMLVCPGGGYNSCSDREATPIATSFLAKGFNAYVLTYSTKSVSQKDCFPVQLLQAAAAIDYIKNKASEHRTDENKIAVCGFSAGGHLAGMISCLFDCDSVKKAFPNKPDNYFRPFASVLSYAVLSADPEIAHSGSIENVSGGDKKVMEFISLEKRVKENTPPAFIWHTSDDGCVDCRNALRYAEALRKYNIPFGMHVYPHGQHGIALANQLTSNGRTVIENDYIATWVDEATHCLLKIFA